MTDANQSGTATRDRPRMLKDAPAAAIALAAMGMNLPANLPEALDHYRELRVLAPHSIRATLDQTARNF